MVFMTNMRVIKDRYVTNCSRHAKVEFDNKNFRRFYFGYKGRTAEILWLSNERKFIPDSLEKFLEKEFKKVG